MRMHQSALFQAKSLQWLVNTKKKEEKKKKLSTQNIKVTLNCLIHKQIKKYPDNKDCAEFLAHEHVLK